MTESILSHPVGLHTYHHIFMTAKLDLLAARPNLVPEDIDRNPFNFMLSPIANKGKTGGGDDPKSFSLPFFLLNVCIATRIKDLGSGPSAILHQLFSDHWDCYFDHAETSGFAQELLRTGCSIVKIYGPSHWKNKPLSPVSVGEIKGIDRETYLFGTLILRSQCQLLRWNLQIEVHDHVV